MGVLVQLPQEADVKTGLDMQEIWGTCLEENGEGAGRGRESSQILSLTWGGEGIEEMSGRKSLKIVV